MWILTAEGIIRLCCGTGSCLGQSLAKHTSPEGAKKRTPNSNTKVFFPLITNSQHLHFTEITLKVSEYPALCQINYSTCGISCHGAIGSLGLSSDFNLWPIGFKIKLTKMLPYSEKFLQPMDLFFLIKHILHYWEDILSHNTLNIPLSSLWQASMSSLQCVPQHLTSIK